MSKRLLFALSVSLWLSAVLAGQTLPGIAEDNNIFGLGKLHLVSVSMSRGEWDVLQTSVARSNGGVRGEDYTTPEGRLVHVGGGFGGYFPWVRADLVLNGLEIKDTGLRYKGNASFVKPTPGNPFRTNIKVKTDLFDAKADWEGVETLNFNAGARDPSLMREALAFAVFRAAGVPAPRTAYAELTFNVPGLHENAPGGVFTLVENVNKQFLKHALPLGNGLLMKPEGTRGGVLSLGANWDAYIPVYRPEREATPHEQQRVMEFAGLISQTDVALFREKIGTYLDVDEFLRFVAVNVFIANNDSYLTGNHNYYLYLDPKDDKFRFIPWDQDGSMGGPFARAVIAANVGPDLLRPPGANNALIYWLLDDPAVLEKYRAIVKELAATVFTAPVLNKMIAEAEQVIPNGDPATKTFLNTRATAVQSLLPAPVQ
jgi:spore coat protein H